MDSGQSIGVRLARRDESALEDAYAAYGPSVLTYLRRYVGANDAEDVLQRTFLDVWRARRALRPGPAVHRLAVHHRPPARDRHAATRRHAVVDVDALRELVGEDGRDTMERYADAAEVREAQSRLPTHEQEMLELAYFEDLTQVEIAARPGVPLGHRQGPLLARAPAAGHAHASGPRGGGAMDDEHPDLAALLRGRLEQCRGDGRR